MFILMKNTTFLHHNHDTSNNAVVFGSPFDCCLRRSWDFVTHTVLNRFFEEAGFKLK
jgi:hypothetical protein